MIDINNIKGLQELFKEKLFEVASTDKIIEDIYPIVRLANYDIECNNNVIWDNVIWNICSEIVAPVKDFELYKFYADKFHYDIKYDFEDDTLYIINTHKDSNNLIANTLKNKDSVFNGKDYIIKNGFITIIFRIKE